MGTKNNPQNRGESAKGKVYDGKPVKPFFYIGKNNGHGNYMAAQYDNGSPVVGKDGKPLAWGAI